MPSAPLDRTAVGPINDRLRKLPHFQTMTSGVRSVTSTGGLLAFLDAYITHATAEVEELRVMSRAGSRAATVLRGLRSDLANVVSTLRELDADGCPDGHDPMVSGYCGACGVRLVDDVPAEVDVEPDSLAAYLEVRPSVGIVPVHHRPEQTVILAINAVRRIYRVQPDGTVVWRTYDEAPR